MDAEANLLDTDDKGLTPLHHACRHGRKEVVTYLVSRSKLPIITYVDVQYCIFSTS